MKKKALSPAAFIFVALSVLLLFLNSRYFPVLFSSPDHTVLKDSSLIDFNYFVWRFLMTLSWLSLCLITGLIIGIFDKKFLKEWIDESLPINLSKKYNLINWVLYIILLSFIWVIILLILHFIKQMF